MLRRILMAIIFCLTINSSWAQTTSDIFSPGDAIVTGFSLTHGKDINAKDIIDLNGPSVRIFSLPSSNSFGLVDQPAKFTVQAHEVGQVFGVAVDNSPTPNIFVAATAAYGIAIYQKEKGRIQHGMPGAQFIPGLFGPMDQGGGPTSIWRIDGTTGKVTLFANVTYNGIENTPASLGGLAFDPTTQQLFVVNRATGMIHRFSLDGTDQGVYDHGVAGRSAAGQSSVPFDSATLGNIKNHKFNAQDPKTWGFAPIERRVFAVAVYQQRVFYSVYGSQIWSVGIASDGSFANDPRLEVEVPALQSDIEISSIAFDDHGLMYIAERGFPTGDSDFITVAQQGQERVMRFSPKNPEDSSPSYWNSPGEEYAIGMHPDYQNANGGVDTPCGKNVWSTGENLLAESEAKSTVNGLQGNAIDLVKPQNRPPEKSWIINYYDTQSDVNTHGHIGAIAIWKSCATGSYVTASGTPSTPPALSLPPSLATPPAGPGLGCPLGDCGALPPCFSCCFPWLGGWGIDPWWGGGWGVGPWGIGPWGVGPWGIGPWGVGPWGVGPWGIGPWGIDPWCGGLWGMPWLDPWGFPCIHICPCLFDVNFWDGPCVLPLAWCPGFVIDGHCFSPIWPIVVINEFLKHQTAPITACPPSEHLVNGKCIPMGNCKPNEHKVHGKCIPNVTCQSDEHLVNGKCIPNTSCKSYERLVDGKCVPAINCKPNERLVHGKCVSTPTCNPGEQLIHGKCVPTTTCKPNEHLVHGKCIPNRVCKPNEHLVHDKCVPNITCKPYERLIHGKCVPIATCKSNEHWVNGKCVPNITCKSNEHLVHGKCVPNITCKPYERLVHGRCVPIIKCKSYERLINGKCVPITNCKSNERLINGKCVPYTHCKPNERLVHGKCVPTQTSCKTGEILINGRCISKQRLEQFKKIKNLNYHSTSR